MTPNLILLISKFIRKLCKNFKALIQYFLSNLSENSIVFWKGKLKVDGLKNKVPNYILRHEIALDFTEKHKKSNNVHFARYFFKIGRVEM